MLTRSFGHPRIVTLLQPLADKKIDSKEKLLAEWYTSIVPLFCSLFVLFSFIFFSLFFLPFFRDKDKKFLFTGVLSWVKERYRQYLVPMWPPLDELKVFQYYTITNIIYIYKNNK